MSGPWKHPDSGIYYFRRDTPSDLKRHGQRLKALGVDYRASIHRSLNTRDRRDAERLYNNVKQEVDALWSRWRLLLEIGPQPLAHTALAGIVKEATERFLDAHEVEPEATPEFPPIELPPGTTFGPQTQKAYKAMSRSKREAFLNMMAELAAGTEATRNRITQDILAAYSRDGSYGFLLADIMPAFAAEIERQAGPHAADVLSLLHSLITPADKAHANMMMVREQANARAALESSAVLDFRQLRDLRERLDSMPPFDPKAGTKKTTKPDVVTFTGIVDEEERRGRDKDTLMASKRGKASTTISKYRRIAEDFELWRKSGDVVTVTPAEVTRWMEHLYIKSGNTRSTVRGKAEALQAITKWGQRHSNNRLFPNGLPLDGLTLPEKDEVDSTARTYCVEQATVILRASRKETKVERRWIPWLLAYSGMRVNEASQLTASDFEMIEGHWFANVRDDGSERTTKTHKGRKVPLHSAVIAEGFMDFVKKQKAAARIFPKRTQANLYEWVTEEVLKDEKSVPPPNHGWRHFFRDLCRRYRVDHEAEHFISGRSFGREHEALARSSANSYGGTDLRLKGYAEELEKIQPLKV